MSFSPNSSESLDIFKKRIKLVNFTSLLDGTCKDCELFYVTTNN